MSSSRPARKRWEKIRDPRCDCGAGAAFIHAAGCPQVGLRIRVEEEPATPAIYHSHHPLRRAAKKKKRLRNPPPIPPYRFRLQFQFTRPINIDLWKKLEAPAGWRKLPTSKSKQLIYRGVRFQCDDLKYALTPEAIQLLHMKLLLSLEGTF